MATASLITNSFVSALTGQCVWSKAQYGSNGVSAGDPEVLLGSDETSWISTRKLWDSASSFDSGTISILLSAEAGGGTNGVSWSVAGSSDNPLTYVSRSYTTIQKVNVRVAVRRPAAAAISGLQVKFFRSGRVIESYYAPSVLQVDMTAASDPIAAEQILEVTPAATNATKVTISGNLIFQYDGSLIMADDDLFADLRVFAASCAAV